MPEKSEEILIKKFILTVFSDYEMRCRVVSSDVDARCRFKPTFVDRDAALMDFVDTNQTEMLL